MNPRLFILLLSESMLIMTEIYNHDMFSLSHTNSLNCTAFHVSVPIAETAVRKFNHTGISLFHTAIKIIF